MKLLENEIIKDMIYRNEISEGQVSVLEKAITPNLIELITQRVVDGWENSHFILGEIVTIKPIRIENDGLHHYLPGGDYQIDENNCTTIRLFYKNSPKEISLYIILHELLHHYFRVCIYKHDWDEEVFVSLLASILSMEKEIIMAYTKIRFGKDNIINNINSK